MTQTTPDYRSEVVNTDSLGFRYSRDRNGGEVHFDNSLDCKVSLFVGNLAFFDYSNNLDGVKIGVLIGSSLSAITGYLLLLIVTQKK